MALTEGVIREVWLDDDGGVGALLEIKCGHFPPGRWFSATGSVDAEFRLPQALYSAGTRDGLVVIAPPLPREWGPGTRLKLRGPNGRGFALPAGVRHVALAAVGCRGWRLVGLAQAAVQAGADVVFLGETRPPDLPLAVEVLPLDGLREMAAWADYLALDVDSGGQAPAAGECVHRVRALLGLEGRGRLGAVCEALISVPMPCGGTGECGVCAVETRGGWKLACKDGPVFDFNELVF